MCSTVTVSVCTSSTTSCSVRAGEHPVDVGAAVDDLVEHHVAGAELGEARREVVGERAFPDRAVVECLRSGLQRIDARDAYERRHRLGKLLGTDVHASV